MRTLLAELPAGDHIVIATPDWYMNISEVAMPDPTGATGFSAVTLFPGNEYDARQH